MDSYPKNIYQAYSSKETINHFLEFVTSMITFKHIDLLENFLTRNGSQGEMSTTLAGKCFKHK